MEMTPGGALYRGVPSHRGVPVDGRKYAYRQEADKEGWKVYEGLRVGQASNAGRARGPKKVPPD